MLEKIFEDINKALDAEAYISALALALTIPDMCGKSEYPNEKSSRKRYIDWFDTYMGVPPREKILEKLTDRENETIMPYLTGHVVYQLRCNLLHETTPIIEKNDVVDDNKEIDEVWNVDKFVLITEQKKDFDMYVHVSSIRWTSGEERIYKLNIRKICADLMYVATAYFNKYPDKKPIIQFVLFDWDKAISDIGGGNRRNHE